jgi:hypothetical protein
MQVTPAQLHFDQIRLQAGCMTHTLCLCCCYLHQPAHQQKTGKQESKTGTTISWLIVTGFLLLGKGMKWFNMQCRTVVILQWKHHHVILCTPCRQMLLPMARARSSSPKQTSGEQSCCAVSISTQQWTIWYAWYNMYCFVLILC